ncbi:hypothetical protein [Leuconostoc mesenteroides]|uniref:hypothetical protein n=1 Tax=Leuconostoc mesenteroides TaxID=1245 RepID=UPI0022464B7F|nr:hypothetical protein [Leuconostoc mesenteroides]MCX2666596.1 hypothetical protein [Leuconostoc mesenteroides subsp. mesenteroides]
MNEKEVKRLKRIKASTEVNEQFIEQHKRTSHERHQRSRAQVKSEIYENKNIDYRKHMSP